MLRRDPSVIQKPKTEFEEASPMVIARDNRQGKIPIVKPTPAKNRVHRLKVWLYVFILIVATLSIYAHTSHYGFIGWDDGKDILNKPRIQQLTVSSVSHLFNPFGIFRGQYYYEYFPVTDLMYMVEWHFYGKDFPQGFHIDNVLLQLINVILLFFAIKILLFNAGDEKYKYKALTDTGSAGKNDNTKKTAAFLIALIFAVHPIMAENISWLSGRKDLLVLMFYLLWFIFYMRSDRGYRAAFVFFVLAILSKFQAVTIPGVLIAYEVFINKSGFKEIKKKLGPYVIVLLIYVPYTMWYYHKGATAFVDNMGILWTLMFIPEAIFIYMRKLLLPFNLTPVYTIPSLSGVGLFFISIIFFTILCIWIIRLARQKNFLYLFGISWFFANFIPVSNIISLPTKIADRYMYEAGIGIFIVAGLWMADFFAHAKSKRNIIGVYAVIFISLAFLSYRQSLHWQNSYKLWNYTISLQPKSAIARNNLGTYYKSHSRPNKAEHEFELALKYNENFVPAMWNLGNIYLDKADYKKALSLFNRMSLIRTHAQYMAFRALGALYLAVYNKPALAKKYFELSYKLKPDQPDAKTLRIIIKQLSDY